MNGSWLRWESACPVGKRTSALKSAWGKWRSSISCPEFMVAKWWEWKNNMTSRGQIEESASFPPQIRGNQRKMMQTCEGNCLGFIEWGGNSHGVVGSRKFLQPKWKRTVQFPLGRRKFWLNRPPIKRDGCGSKLWSPPKRWQKSRLFAVHRIGDETTQSYRGYSKPL